MTRPTPPAQASDEPMRANIELVIARLEQIAGNYTDDPRNAAEEALVCARAVLGDTPPDEPEPAEAYWAVAANGERCAFGRYSFAKAWAGENGTVETVQLRQFTLIESIATPRNAKGAAANMERVTPDLAEFVQVYLQEYPSGNANDAERAYGGYAGTMWLAAKRSAHVAPTEAQTLEDLPVLMKDHNVRQLVNDLRDIAIQFHAAGQLRARISGAVGQFLDKHGVPNAPTEAQEPAVKLHDAGQGEDSARLVDGYIGAVVTAQSGRAAKLALLYDTEKQAIAASDFIGELVARASAETGGVKS